MRSRKMRGGDSTISVSTDAVSKLAADANQLAEDLGNLVPNVASEPVVVPPNVAAAASEPGDNENAAAVAPGPGDNAVSNENAAAVAPGPGDNAVSNENAADVAPGPGDNAVSNVQNDAAAVKPTSEPVAAAGAVVKPTSEPVAAAGAVVKPTEPTMFTTTKGAQGNPKLSLADDSVFTGYTFKKQMQIILSNANNMSSQDPNDQTIKTILNGNSKKSATDVATLLNAYLTAHTGTSPSVFTHVDPTPDVGGTKKRKRTKMTKRRKTRKMKKTRKMRKMRKTMKI